MAEEQDALRRHIVSKREEVADDLLRLRGELESTYASATDWRRIVRSRPLIFLGAALGLGLLVGLTIGDLFGFEGAGAGVSASRSHR